MALYLQPIAAVKGNPFLTEEPNMKIQVDKNVLVPIDFSEFSANTISYALTLFPKDKLRLMHVSQRPTVTSPGMVWDTITDDTIINGTMTAFEEFCKKHGLPEDLNFSVEIGDPAEEISLEAKHNPAGLIIVGSHGRRGLSRFFLGSVAERVVRHAPCPVLVFKPDEIVKDRNQQLAEISAKTDAMFEPEAS